MRKRQLAAAAPAVAAAAGTITAGAGLMKVLRRAQLRRLRNKVEEKTNVEQAQLDTSQ